jgi:hypothetical protein
MKNIRYKFIRVTMTLLLIVLMSCSEEFIDLQPTDTVSVGALYKTDNDFNDAVNGAYNGLMQVYKTWWWYGDLRGDDSYDELVKGHSYFDLFTLDVNDGTVSASWRDWYITVFRCNVVLDQIASKDVALIPNKDRYIGEAKFIRALSYFNLVRIFGDVPMITKPVGALEAYTIPRKALATIYSEVIIPDLLDAETKLPVSYTTSTLVGKATSGAAKSLLGEVYLTLKDFQKAEAKLRELTASPFTYKLLAKYDDLFKYDLNEHHTEYIFDIEYKTGGLGLGHTLTNNFCPKDVATLKFYGLTTGDGNNNPPFALFDIFPAGDKRKEITCANGYTDANGVYHKLLPNANDVQTYTRKYIYTTQSGAGDSGANWKVYRYGDVILMFAEALNENGKTSEALTQLNLIRVRAGVPVYTGLTQSQTRDAIALERRLELSFEGKRWFDLVRTGKALSTMASTGMKDYMTIWPVPQNQMDLYNNTTIFWQNPGYN